jgi:hypothetical protein
MTRLAAAFVFLAVLAPGCGGPRDPEAARPASGESLPPCYPYLARDGECPGGCRTIDDCAGSRGPADFAEKGWPLDCIDGRCVPLPPETVQGGR